MIKRHTHLRIHQGDSLELIDDIPEFRLIRLQEFPAGGNIKEKILYREDTSLVTSLRLDTLQIGTRDGQAGTKLRPPSPGTQLYMGDSGDRGQCLTPETHRMQRE